MKTQTIIIAEGPDRVGKTEISKELSKRLSIPYFKNGEDVTAFLKNDSNYFRNTAKYAEPFFLNYLKQTESSVILDRGYVSEVVYSSLFNRETCSDELKIIDEMYASLGTYILFCHRKSYTGIQDDVDPERLNEKMLVRLDAEYRKFMNFTKCKVINLYVDDYDLSNQMLRIYKQMNII